MKLAVGLGNPGERYLATRHNVGFRVVSALARTSGIDLCEQRFAGLYGDHARAASIAGRLRGFFGVRAKRPAPELGLLLPHTFMNNSGESVAQALAELPVADIATDFAVVVDDLDLPFGRIRIRPSGGAGGHRGLASLIEHLDSRSFPRLRFGIGRPTPGHDTVQYVLAPFSPAEEELLEDRIATAVEALETLFREGVTAAMSQFNQAPAADGQDPIEAPPKS